MKNEKELKVSEKDGKKNEKRKKKEDSLVRSIGNIWVYRRLKEKGNDW